MENKDGLQLDPKDTYTGSAYPFGMDPIWQVAKANKIIFHNGYKMKISIIFGVIHMMFGVIMSLRNYRYFNDHLSVITTFVPQMFFLVALFFYLALLMFIKWLKYSAKNAHPWTSDCAPSILITFINMVLFKNPNYPEKEDECSPYMFWGQRGFQQILVLSALLCVPWMLLAKPMNIMKSRKAAAVKINF